MYQSFDMIHGQVIYRRFCALYRRFNRRNRLASVILPSLRCWIWVLITALSIKKSWKQSEPRINEQAFDSDRKMMTTVHKERLRPYHRLYKGRDGSELLKTVMKLSLMAMIRSYYSMKIKKTLKQQQRKWLPWLFVYSPFP